MGVQTAIEMLAIQHPGKYRIGVRSACPDVFAHNPHLSPVHVGLPWREIKMGCSTGGRASINRSCQQPCHFLDCWVQHLATELGINLDFRASRPALHLSDWERHVRPGVLPPGRFALINAGHKEDFTAKHAGTRLYQGIVSGLRDKVTFIQVGSIQHRHPPLEGVVNLVGKTSIRDLIRMTHFADFCVTPVSFLHHVAAALGKPCFTFNSREPDSFIWYPTARLYSNSGLLPCNRLNACWKNKSDPNDGDGSKCLLPVFQDNEYVPQCMAMIDPRRVVEDIRSLYQHKLPFHFVNNTYVPCPNNVDDTEPMLQLDYHSCPPDPSVGVLITHYGKPGLLALQLEAMKRFNPGVPILVADDCSTRSDELISLCKMYGVEFVSNSQNYGHIPGDIAMFGHGLRWAKLRGLDLLVKISQSWLVLKPWVEEFKALAVASKHHTFSGRCDHYNFGFRTECLGMLVRSYLPFLGDITSDAPGCTHAESYMHQRIAQRIPTHPDADVRNATDPGYCYWWDMYATKSRMLNPPEIYRHETNSVEDYWALARTWKLPVVKSDFER